MMWPFGRGSGSNRGGGRNDIQLLLMLAAASAVSFSLIYFTYQHMFSISDKSGNSDDDLDEFDEEPKEHKGDEAKTASPSKVSSDDNGLGSSTPTTPVQGGAINASRSRTPIISNTSASLAREKDAKDAPRLPSFGTIEALDKEGKLYFKNKQFLKAADSFTKAIETAEFLRTDDSPSKQEKTLINNRSAMYEKQALAVEGVERQTWVELSLADIDTLLSYDTSHTKARIRRLRLLEMSQPPKYFEAIIDVCALQLLFMQEHRDRLRMGLPLPPNVKPPVDQSQIESLMEKVLPIELERIMEEKEKQKQEGKANKVPSINTITSLLKSFRGYNSWMSAAAKDETTTALSEMIERSSNDSSEELSVLIDRMSLHLRRGLRYAFDKNFSLAVEDFDTGIDIVEQIEKNGSPSDKIVLESNENYPRLLEWAGLGKHLRYDLNAASKLYEKCSELEPTNTEILVKRAGVHMDNGKLDEAVPLFETALALQPDATDALIHRSNLYMMKAQAEEAKADLERCISLRPDLTFAYLRLATLKMAIGDTGGADEALNSAEKLEPESSDVHSYRGELYFAKGDLPSATAEFKRAIELNSSNPNAYVNLALAVMNTPTDSQIPDFQEAVRLLEKAIEVDPQCHTAYVHLGQIQLSMATNLIDARKVVSLYDRGLESCRTKEESKEICQMRILAVSQVEAASILGLETLKAQ